MYNCFIIKTLFHPSKNQLKTVLNFAECSLYSLLRRNGLSTSDLGYFSQMPCDYATKVTKYQRCNFIIQITNSVSRSIQLASTYFLNVSLIVEFNFNSHVFLVMYQEILFVNQHVSFLNQEERRQFLIRFVSERDWKREHKLEFKMASNRFYIPKVNEFFEGLISLLQQCGDCVNENTDGGHAEFLARRLEEYQRTLRVMYGRVTESAQDYCSRINLLRIWNV